jgi:hypothetical protein
MLVDSRFSGAVAFLEQRAKNGLDCGIVVLEIYGLPHHQDCFGSVEATKSLERIEAGLKDVVARFDGILVAGIRGEFWAICPGAARARRLAELVSRTVSDMRIRVVDDAYARRYWRQAEEILSLTASVLLLDGQNRYDSVDPLFKNASTLQELATAYRPGKVTILDLTSRDSARQFPYVKSIRRLFGLDR